MMGMDDSTLISECVVLVDDIAHRHPARRRVPEGGPPWQTQQEKDDSDSIASRITLSGLLSALGTRYHWGYDGY